MVQKYKLVLSNTYGHPNVGDEAILHSMLVELSSSLKNPELSVLTLYPELTAFRHPAARAVASGVFNGSSATWRTIKEADAFILGGGGIIQDKTSLGNLLFHLSRVMMAVISGTPVISYGLGVGPLQTKVGRLLTAVLLSRAHTLCVRDQISADLLQQIGVSQTKIQVTADPALLLEVSDHTPKLVQDIQKLKQQCGYLVGVSLRPFDTHYRLFKKRRQSVSSIQPLFESVVKNVRLFAQETSAGVVFFSMHPGQDNEVGQLFLERMGSLPSLFVPGDTLPTQMLAAIKAVDMLIGMRLHAIIFATRTAVPAIALAYQPKVTGFMEMAGQSPLVVSTTNRSNDELRTVILKVWQEREKIRTDSNQILPELQFRARKNTDAVIELLSKK